MARLYALVGCIVGLALAAPAAWFAFYKHAHPEAVLSPEAAVFFTLVAAFGLSIAVRSAWRLIKGE